MSNDIKEFRRWKEACKDFEKMLADPDQTPWIDDNEAEVPGWVCHMMSELEPKFVWYYEKFLKNSKEDLAKRCALGEIKKERPEPKIPTILRF